MTKPRDLHSFTTTEVKKLFKKARGVAREATHTILVAPKTGEYGRLLVCTPRRIGNAPTRNLIRRRLKALWYEEGYYKLPYDCVIIAKEAGTNHSYENWKEALERIKKCSNGQ